MSNFTPTIGLEIHVELKTKTKMFCNSVNNPDEKRPNVNICPICLGHPGTLPTINKEAVKHVLRVGLALGGQLADYTEFERKNYFYPDIPKGYQISQYKYPLVTGGSLAEVALTRIHLEEDTGRLQHDSKSGFSFVDFNRAGVPLMELVTEPVITSAKQAADFARELQLLLRYLAVSDADMEKGQMRVEANISIALAAPSLGTKVEIKNLNSFRSVERAIEYEIKRQSEVLGRGEQVMQETRGWDDIQRITFSQREKESAHDYRYFPEPDLPPLKLSEIPEFQNLAQTLPELPSAKRERYKKDFGIKDEDIEIYINNQSKANEFESVMKILGEKRLAKSASNYILNEVKSSLPVSSVAGTIRLIDGYELSSRGAKELFKVLPEKEVDVRKFAEERGLIQKSDESMLVDVVEQVINANPKTVADYRAGKAAALQFLIGQGIKESGGAANPTALKKLFEKALK